MSLLSPACCEQDHAVQYSIVNGVDISEKTHAEAVAFLRSCPEVVTLRLYRDMDQTPVSPLSPTATSVEDITDSTNKRNIGSSPSTLRRNKLKFRQEAQDMLLGLAIQRGKTPPNASPNFNSLGRQRRLKQMQNSNASSSATSFSSGMMPGGTEVLIVTRSRVKPDTADKPRRPNYLDLNLDSPGSKKQKFVFTPPSSYRDKGLGSESEADTSLDAPHVEQSPSLDFPDLDADSFLNEVLDACEKTHKSGSFLAKVGDKGEDATDAVDGSQSGAFGHRTQGYQSVNLTPKEAKGNGNASGHAASTHFSDQDIPHQFTSLTKANVEKSAQEEKTEGTQGLLKWRGQVFSADGSDGEDDGCLDYQLALGPPPPMPPPNPENENREILLTLQRGWNSRLGFSLRSYTQSGKPGSYVSAIYADSVAFRDGRLRVGDRLMRVNTLDVSEMPTSEVISILRTMRGPILLILIRPPSFTEE
ncbi:unnamed protein product [Notodromas monacha]|uniref:PDZ domain-containing protein n=1 Tax=Notodromas monacha TaxID=399045 RepID=A0A7R9BHU0_9CRUS|nr:unnamed protein product [Notodromas monacha]CAG0914171.1 unnamed protein product [Notodromas monacha]